MLTLLGKTDDTDHADPFEELRSFVKLVEKPTGGMKLPHLPNERDAIILAKMEALSEDIRKGLALGVRTKAVRPTAMGFIDFSAIGGALSSVVTKVAEVAARPGFMTSLANAASFIPRIGPAVGGILTAIAPLAPATATNAAASSAATSQAFGLPGNILNFLPESLRKPAEGLLGKLIPQAQTGGNDFLSMVLKGIGQFVATQQLSSGAGAGGVGSSGVPGSELSGLAKLIAAFGGSNIQNAIQAGRQDYLNAASVSGSSSVVQKAFENADRSDFPWVPVLAVGGGALTLVTIIALATRRPA